MMAVEPTSLAAIAAESNKRRKQVRPSRNGIDKSAAMALDLSASPLSGGADVLDLCVRPSKSPTGAPSSVHGGSVGSAHSNGKRQRLDNGSNNHRTNSKTASSNVAPPPTNAPFNFLSTQWATNLAAVAAAGLGLTPEALAPLLQQAYSSTLAAASSTPAAPVIVAEAKPVKLVEASPKNDLQDLSGGVSENLQPNGSAIVNGSTRPVSPGESLYRSTMAARLADRVECDICFKQVCNKYFLKQHKLKIHGITPSASTSAQPTATSSVQAAEQSAAEEDAPLVIDEAFDNNNGDMVSDEDDQKSPKRPASLLDEAKAFVEKLPLPATSNIPTPSPPIAAVPTTFQIDSGAVDLTAPTRHPVAARNSTSTSSVTSTPAPAYYAAVQAAVPSQPQFWSSPSTSLNGGGGSSRRWKDSASNSRVTCEICGKELCNKYFLRTHKQNRHGIKDDRAPTLPTKKTGTDGSNSETGQAADSDNHLASPSQTGGSTSFWSGRRVSRCAECGKRFHSHKVYQMHMHICHGIKVLNQVKKETVPVPAEEEEVPSTPPPPPPTQLESNGGVVTDVEEVASNNSQGESQSQDEIYHRFMRRLNGSIRRRRLALVASQRQRRVDDSSRLLRIVNVEGVGADSFEWPTSLLVFLKQNNVEMPPDSSQPLLVSVTLEQFSNDSKPPPVIEQPNGNNISSPEGTNQGVAEEDGMSSEY